jgi:nitronate monooxygenase
VLRTRFSDLLGLTLPVMNAPMSDHSGGKLAAAVSQAGGLGTFGGSNGFGPDWLRQQIQHIRATTDRPFGVGFITQLIEADPENFEIVLEERVPVVIFLVQWPAAVVRAGQGCGSRPPSARCSPWKAPE